MSYTLPKIIAVASMLASLALAFIENKKVNETITRIVLYEIALAVLMVIARLEG